MRTEVEIKGDFGIESAYIDEKGNLIAEFEDLSDLEQWNSNVRWYKQHCGRVYPSWDASMPRWHVDIQLKANNAELNYDDDVLYDTDEYVECEDCGKVVEKDSAYYVDDDDRYVCESCYDDHYFTCEDCGHVCHVDHMIDIDGSYYCEDCADNHGHQCADCGEWFDYDHILQAPDGTWYCEDCFYDHCDYCCRCGEVVWTDDAYYEDGECYCEYCHDEYCADERHIRQYHHNPDLCKHYAEGEERHGKLIGTEVETDSNEDNVDERAEITWNFGDEEDTIYQMHDGSLSEYGIECITQPMSKKYWDKFDFETWMKELVEAGARAHDTDTCGLHVHLSRTWLGTDDEDEQAILVGRMRQFLADNISTVQKFARRTSERWCKYTKSYDKEDMPETKEERLTKHKEKGKEYDRYQSINNNNSNTIEFRIFKGTLKPNTYRASVEFCLRVVDYILHTEENTETWEKFITYKKLPKSMRVYMEERGMQTTF